jgi:hypothetical protein
MWRGVSKGRWTSFEYSMITPKQIRGALPLFESV